MFQCVAMGDRYWNDKKKKSVEKIEGERVQVCWLEHYINHCSSIILGFRIIHNPDDDQYSDVGGLGPNRQNCQWAETGVSQIICPTNILWEGIVACCFRRCWYNSVAFYSGLSSFSPEVMELKSIRSKLPLYLHFRKLTLIYNLIRI